MKSTKGKYAAIYARTSREDSHREKMSIPDQIERGREFAESRGYLVDDKYVFADEGVSSRVLPRQLQEKLHYKSKTRKGLTEALDAILSRKCEALVIRDIDRMARKLRDNIRILDLLRKVDEKFDLIMTDSSLPEIASSLGQYQLHSQLGLMQYHLDRSVEYGRRVFKVKSSKGEKFGSANALYGYDDGRNEQGIPIQNTIVLKQDEVPLVKDIFEWFTSDNYGLSRIASQLDDKYPNSSKRNRKLPWTTQTVRRILANPKYCGLQWDDSANSGTRSLITSKFPPIVSIQVWKTAQDLLKKRAGRKFLKHESTIMTGLVRCAACGSSLRAHRDKGTRYVRYYCMRKDCSNKAFPMLLSEWQRFWNLFGSNLATSKWNQRQTLMNNSDNSDWDKVAKLEQSLAQIDYAIQKGRATFNDTLELREKTMAELSKTRTKMTKAISRGLDDWDSMSDQEKNLALHDCIDLAYASNQSLVIRLKNSRLFMEFPLLHIWGKLKYKLSLIPSPYLIDETQLDKKKRSTLFHQILLFEEQYGRQPDENNPDKSDIFNWSVILSTGYTDIKKTGKYIVLRNPYDAPLSRPEILKAASKRLPRRTIFESRIKNAKKATFDPFIYLGVPAKTKTMLPKRLKELRTLFDHLAAQLNKKYAQYEPRVLSRLSLTPPIPSHSPAELNQSTR